MERDRAARLEQPCCPLAVMEDRLRTLMANYGLDDITDLAREIQGRCEAAMRGQVGSSTSRFVGVGR